VKDHSKRRHLRSLIEETKVDFCLMQEMNCERMEESFVWEIWGPMGFDFKWQLKPFVGVFLVILHPRGCLSAVMFRMEE